jgi:hypothetical protein
VTPRFCHSCGHQVEAHWKFCPQCSERLVAVAVAAPEPAPAPAPPEPVLDVAELAAPARPLRFALVRPPATTTTIEELDAQIDSKLWLVPAPGERIVGRWTCLLVMSMVPAQIGAGEMVEGFRGAGAVMLTSRRVVGTLIQGESGGRQLDANRGLVLCYSFDLRELDEVSLTQKKGSFGAVKETGLLLNGSDGSLLMCDMDRSVDERMRSSRGSRAEAMQRIIGQAIAARGASPSDAPWLAAAAAGRWEMDAEGDRTARLVPPQT